MLVDWAVDGLCFTNDNVVLEDCTVVTSDSAPKLRQLRSEQESRIRQLYGPQPLPPDALAEHLEELYKADADSLAEAAPGEPTVIDSLTDLTARIFKKEMKQRIHDWEGAFRERYGREATAQDKMRLRAIYELYKAVKTRVTEGAVLNPGASTNSQQQQQQAPHHSNPNVSRMTSGAATPNGPGSRPGSAISASSQPSPATDARPSHRESTTPHQGSNASSAPGLPQGVESVPDAVAQKKTLKRLLHEFEERFKSDQGRAPTKEDRRPLQREYHRYGELKAFLAAQGISSGAA
jgi:hypothetical protein